MNWNDPEIRRATAKKKPTPIHSKALLREQLRRDVKKYLESGRKINMLEPQTVVCVDDGRYDLLSRPDPVCRLSGGASPLTTGRQP